MWMHKTSAPTVVSGARPLWLSWTILATGVLAASVAAILIRYASGAEPLAISFWRCAAGAVVLAPFARFRRGETTLKPSLVAGAFLAVHFATWITSLELTTVAESVLLVSTSPVFVALVAWWLWSERLSARGWVGIAIAMGGSGLTGVASQSGDSSLGGNALAIAGGAAAAGYLLGGREARRSLGIIEYSVLAYAAAAVLLLPVCLATGADLWGFPAKTWWAIAGLIVGPQLLGHTLINYVLTDIHPTLVSVTIMAEPIIATLLAFVLFSETPSGLVYPGGAAILAGIYLVTIVRRTPSVIVE
jgi:drug/metabolite transporter (DMT)-like permease